jgi:hypothetical protein
MSSIVVAELKYAPPGADSLFFDVGFTVSPGERALEAFAELAAHKTPFTTTALLRDRPYNAGGTTAIRMDSPLECTLRDAHGYATHRWVAHPLYGEIGKIYLGHEPGATGKKQLAGVCLGFRRRSAGEMPHNLT